MQKETLILQEFCDQLLTKNDIITNTTRVKQGLPLDFISSNMQHAAASHFENCII